MIKVNMTWNGPACLAEVRGLGWERLQRVVVFFWTQVTLALNVSNPRPYKTPSKIGEPPRKRTGWGQRNVLYELDEPNLSAKVGLTANAWYMSYWETHGRSWLLSTLRKVEKQLNALAGG